MDADRSRRNRLGPTRFSLNLKTGAIDRQICNALGVQLNSYGLPGDRGRLLDDSTSSELKASGTEKFAIDYLVDELLTKYDDKKANPVKETETWRRFQEAEDLCYDTNQRLHRLRLNGDLDPVIQRARNICDKILGGFSWDRAARFFNFGPGATTRCPRTRADAAWKYSGNPESTMDNSILANAAIAAVPVWERGLAEVSPDAGIGRVVVVQGNRVVTVPKNYKTDRTIAIEPCMNMYIQKGIGGYMRDRLRLAGCDLNDQTVNQRLAFRGSVDGHLATVDLSMASDTVSREIVAIFIRPDWLSALEQSRSKHGVLPSGDWLYYQKFSSMGNGYTFELESLILLALSRACTELIGAEAHPPSVYGDDIIIDVRAVAPLFRLLDYCGFKANVKKTFTSGPFRESCGKHFHNGHDVTPFYIRRPVRKLTDLFLLHNNLWRWKDRCGYLLSPEREAGIQQLLKRLRSYAPAKWREPRIVDGFGDGAFIGYPSEVFLPKHPLGWECSVARVLIESFDSEEQLEMYGLLVKSLKRLEKGKEKPPFDIAPNSTHLRVNLEDHVGLHPVKGAGIKEKKILIQR